MPSGHAYRTWKIRRPERNSGWAGPHRLPDSAPGSVFALALVLIQFAFGFSSANVHGASAAETNRHWAFLPVQAGVPPAVKRTSWPITALDRFILARLEAEGLKPARPATREQLIRRVSFDLIGLPPSPEDVRTFVQDRSPAA